MEGKKSNLLINGGGDEKVGSYKQTNGENLMNFGNLKD